MKFQKKVFQLFTVLMAALPSFVGAQGLSIGSVSPSSATVGDTVTVTITLQGNQYPPPDPSSITIGEISGSLHSWSEPDVKASFTIPDAASTGTQDVVVVFPGPDGDLTITKSNGFSILPKGDAVTLVYVNANSTAGSPDGKSWPTAYSSLQDGIDLAALYGADVWVAKGTYKPTTGTDREVSFELKSGAKLYGGFTGNETSLNDRDYNANQTILSGEIGTSADTDNSYHVVIGADNATLDGFTITGGYADGEKWNRLGGGMYNAGQAQSSDINAISPVISNCVFTGNYAESGGGMYNLAATAKISGCTFTLNIANCGGGVLFRVGSDATVTNCVFSENSAEWRGGGVYVDYGADPVISGSEFTQNTTQGIGGGFYVDDRASQLGGTYPQISDSTFTGNQALYRGGAMGLYNSSCELTVTGCTFSDNTATNAGGNDIACNSSAILKYNGSPDIDADNTCTVIPQ